MRSAAVLRPRSQEEPGQTGWMSCPRLRQLKGQQDRSHHQSHLMLWEVWSPHTRALETPPSQKHPQSPQPLVRRLKDITHGSFCSWDVQKGEAWGQAEGRDQKTQPKGRG